MASADLDGYVDVMAYELRELSNLTEWIRREWPFETNAEQTLRNALLEAHLLHARCLIEFLLNKDHRGQSITGRDLDPAWKDDEATLPILYKEICDRMSHMSKNRATPAQVSWGVVGILNMIVGQLELLCANLGTEPHAVKFRAAVSEARAACGRATAPTRDPRRSFVTTNADPVGTFITGSTGPPSRSR